MVWNMSDRLFKIYKKDYKCINILKVTVLI